MISGTLMLFEHKAGEALLASLRKIRTQAPRDVAATAREFGMEADAKALAGTPTPDRVLAQAALLFTNAWLDGALRVAQGRERPELLQRRRPARVYGAALPLAAGRGPAWCRTRVYAARQGRCASIPRGGRASALSG